MQRKLTDRWITREGPHELAKSGKPQIIVWDTRTENFGVRIGARGASFIAHARTPTGKLKRVTIGRHGPWSTSKARKDAATKMDELREGKKIHSNTLTLTLQGALEEFINHKLKQTQTRAIKDYRYRIEHYLEDWLQLDMSSITEAMVEEKFDELTDIGNHTANSTMKKFRTVYRRLRRKYGLPPNPTDFLTEDKLYHELKRRKHPRTMKRDIPIIWSAIQSYPTKTLVHLMQLIAWTGCRPCEAMRLEWRDVDFEHKEFTFVATKSGEDHTLPMCREARSVLLRQRQHVSLMDLEERRRDFVFPANQSNRRCGHITEYKKLFDHIERALSYRLVAYDWRRFMASQAVSISEISHAQARHLQNHADRDAHDGYESLDVDELHDPLQAYENHLRKLISRTQPGNRKAA